ncbi:MAG: sodium:proton antiporter, partial [Ottowia sp.]|nr:sodium:proton antiporter [Ottowia sp.]
MSTSLSLLSWTRLASGLGMILASGAASASTFDGSTLSLLWGLPFAATLFSIALGPLLAPHFWHHHYGKIAAFWALLFLLPFTYVYGTHTTLASIVHAGLAEYLPFVILLMALFTAAGGICLHGNLHGRPTLNVGILGLGTLLASVIGTTGAAMLLVRPLIRANDNRQHVTHILVFFIFLVANIGGALSPLGDPPLFLGFLKGVDFFWPLTFVWPHMLLMSVLLLGILYVLDLYYFHQREEERPSYMDPSPDTPVRI